MFNTQNKELGFNATEGGIQHDAVNKLEIPKNELEHQYLYLGKSQAECANYFGCSRSTITSRLRLYAIAYKTAIPNTNYISKEELEYQYIALNKSREECATYFNCSTGKIQALMHKYNIKKDAAIVINNAATKLLQCNVLKDDLYYQYITLNKTQQECANYFGCTRRIIQHRLKTYNIKKEAIQLLLFYIPNKYLSSSV